MSFLMIMKAMERLQVITDITLPMYKKHSPSNRSTGTPAEQNCYFNIETAFEYLTQTLDISPGCIVLYGRSLGELIIYMYIIYTS
jgi:hypothetical protein